MSSTSRSRSLVPHWLTRALMLGVVLSLATLHPRAQTTGASGTTFVLRVPAALAQAVAARNGLTIIAQIDGQDLFLVSKPTSGFNPNGGMNILTGGGVDPTTATVSGDPDVVGFEPNAAVINPEIESPVLNGSTVGILDGISGTTLISYFDNLVWSRYVDQPAATAIGLAASHQASHTGAGIVAIIDTGVDPTHPALAASLVPGYDFIHDTGAASEWSDLDGSTVGILDGSTVGILDGQSFTVNGSTVAILDSATASSIDLSQLPHSFGHGTMVAGLVHLVAPTAKIMPLKAFAADGTSTVFDVVRAIYYAIDHGARVINMSFSAETASPEIMRAINVATSHGIVCVASAGNLSKETLVYPGALRNVMGIGSTNSAPIPVRSPFSNYGSALVSVGAPGEAIVTTYPGGHYAAAWGTSFSTPLVAGGAALLLQVDPNIDQHAASELLLGKAQPMDPAAGMGRGRLNLADAVRTVTDTTPPTVTITAPSAGGTVSGTVLLSASASDNVAVTTVRFLVDGNPVGPELVSAFAQSWATDGLSNGTHVLTAVARDAAGNQQSSVVNVTVSNDASAPTVALTGPADGGLVTGTVTVTAAASDDLGVAGVQFKVDGVALGGEDTLAPYAATWSTAAVTNGSHVIEAIARDAAGHQASSLITIVVGNDAQPPTILLTTPVDGSIEAGVIAVLATATDDVGVVGVQFKIDGANVGQEETNPTYALVWNTAGVANGPHAVAAVARDAAGHETTASITVTVANDNAPPTVTLNLTPGATVTGTVSLLATAADDIGVAGVKLLLDGVLMGTELTAAPYGINWNTVGVTNGSHTITAIARDAAGHETTVSVTITVAN